MDLILILTALVIVAKYIGWIFEELMHNWIEDNLHRNVAHITWGLCILIYIAIVTFACISIAKHLSVI